MAVLNAGTLFANRFEIHNLVGSGGMGAVYLARDLLSREFVALKILHEPTTSEQSARRFAREAQLLALLNHPGIVRYVAHGAADGNPAFLAMEWLQGHDLKQHLRRSSLSLSQSLLLLRQVAQALHIAHSHGVIHRDLKPSNIFLRGGTVDGATLIDFGVARRGTRSQAITYTGMVVGTPEYMAPEQARGVCELTPAADVFALGCIMYECLTGEPPFVGEHLESVLAKVLFASPRSLRMLRPELPESVDDLVGRMLSKAPMERPHDAQAVCAALATLVVAEVDANQRSPASSGRASPNESDQGLVSVLLVAPIAGKREAVTLDSAALELQHEQRVQLWRRLEAYGGRVELLADGSMVAAFTASRGVATDLAAQAAQAALLVQSIWPTVSAALTMGRGAVTGEVPVGEALERAARLLHGGAELPTPECVLVDEVTAGLLDPRFRTHRTASGSLVLDSAELEVDETRLLLGKPTPCIGREAELTALEGLLTACTQDSEPRAVLVTAPPGIGKSRLRREFLRRVAGRREPIVVLLGRGDPLTSSSAYGLLGQAVRQLCAVPDGEPVEIRRRSLQARVGMRLAEPETQHIAEFLGELCGIPFPDNDSSRLRVARKDPQIMGERIKEALLAFLRAECAAQPVLLVLEDLHWSDPSTVRLLDVVLAELGELPLMLLSLARPEISDTYPALWSGRASRMSLIPLSKRTCERLVRQALGPTVAPDQLALIVEQSAGNALFLEELIRATAEGHNTAPPETVLAMLQARIGRLDVSARRALRAASVLGGTFWLGGVRALLGADRRMDDLAAELSALTAVEIIESHRGSRYAGEREFGFRHALMRDAAYGLLTEDERRVGHELCLDYLERVGETDPVLLCEHAIRIKDQERTLHHLFAAAQRSYERCNIDAVKRFTELGLRGALQGELRGALLAVRLWACNMHQGHEETFALGLEALPLLRAGSTRWYFVITQLIIAGRSSGRTDLLRDVIPQVAMTPPEADAVFSYTLSVWGVASIYLVQGLRVELQNLMQACARYVEQAPGKRGHAYAILLQIRSLVASRLEPTIFEAVANAQAAWSAMTDLDHVLYRFLVRAHLAQVLMCVGQLDEGGERLRQLHTEAKQDGYSFYATLATLNLINGLGEHLCPETAKEMVTLGRAVMASAGASRALLDGTLPQIAVALATLGETAEAEQLARGAVAALGNTPLPLVLAHAALSRILLQRGQIAEARQTAEEGLKVLEAIGGSGMTELPLRLAVAEARHADGDTQAAHQALWTAVAQLRLRADGAPDLASRARYLLAIAHHARLVALAQAWLGESVT